MAEIVKEMEVTDWESGLGGKNVSNAWNIFGGRITSTEGKNKRGISSRGKR